MSTNATRLTADTRRHELHLAERDEYSESRRAERYPLSRWYLRPAAHALAKALAPTSVRPVHLTVAGLIAGATAASALWWQPASLPIAAALVLLYWFFDRCDGLLARRQRSVSALGAWLDANVDELVDVGLHAAVAAAIARHTAASWPWLLLAAFLGGKYLLMYGLSVEEHAKVEPSRPAEESRAGGWLRRAYHLPGNADVRIHLLIAALLTGWLTAELALVAVYYNVRWMARYVLVARRLGGAA